MNPDLIPSKNDSCPPWGAPRLWFLVLTMLLCVGAGFVSTSLAADDAFRTWSDASGKFKIKAKYVSSADGMVTLLQEDGEELEIELKKLNAADQKFVADALKAASDNPFKGKAKGEDPFKTKSKKKKTRPTKEESDDADPGEARTVNVNWASAENVVLAQPSEPWKLEVSKGVEGLGAKVKNCSLPPTTGFFEGIKGVVINPVAKKAAVGLINAPPGAAPVTRVMICDLATGKTGPPASEPGSMVPVALHDDGRQIVMCSDDFGFGKHDRLEVWTISGGQISKSLIWTPYGDVQGGDRDVKWAAFVDAETLATSSGGGRVAIWKFPEIEPVCSFALENGAVPALSPDRKWIAYCNGTDVGIFDIAKKEVIAQAASPEKLTWPVMAFSPSGTRIGCVAFDKVLVWDVATGKLDRNISCTGLHVNGSLEFPDDNFILAGNQFLIDIESMIKLWTYSGQFIVKCVGGWTFFGTTAGERAPGALGAGQIPHPAAKEMLKKAATDPTLFVLKAGTTVKLNVDGIPDASQRETVRAALTKRLQTIDCKVAPTGSIELVATMEGPKSTKLAYRRSGEYTFQEYIGRVKFIYEGQPVWESAGSNSPGFIIHLKAGENIESHLRSREKPNYAYFDQVVLPKLLQKPSGNGKAGAGNSLTLGQSKVTTNGLQ